MIHLVYVPRYALGVRKLDFVMMCEKTPDYA